MQFRITERRTERQTVIEAATYEEAASKYAAKTHRTRNEIMVNRVTGDTGKTGYFQAYVKLGPANGDGPWSSIGGNFHVFPLD